MFGLGYCLEGALYCSGPRLRGAVDFRFLPSLRDIEELLSERAAPRNAAVRFQQFVGDRALRSCGLKAPLRDFPSVALVAMPLLNSSDRAL
jgi:hypothetical protein